jgi:hypothetical protein
MRADDELSGMADLSGEGLDLSRDRIPFLQEGYVVRGHDVAATDQERGPAATGLGLNEHADGLEQRENSVALLAAILDEHVGHGHSGNEPECYARSGSELRASFHVTASAISGSAM